MRAAFACGGGALLALVWLGSLPELARHSFAAHMTMHMAVVAVAAPLLGLALAGSALDPMRRWPSAAAPIAASMIELVVVWAWHAPALHQAARGGTAVLVLEQGTFLFAGVLLWVAAAGGGRGGQQAGAGVTALLLTSMHMTLLGALFAMANRPLFRHAGMMEAEALADQHLGGAMMLIVGGASYLCGGLWLSGRLLWDLTPRPRRRRAP